MAGVSNTAGGITATSDGAGRYEMKSSASSLAVTAVVPPSGYEGGYRGYGTLTPGEHDIQTRRVVRLTVAPPATLALSDGTYWRGVNPTVEYDTGVTTLLTGSREEDVRITTSNEAILKPRRDGGRPVIEGLSLGTASVTATYWGVMSTAVSVEVVPNR
ncbi:MAG: hypothetical protein AB7G23_10310 [Vicinamibacterales bacterium]